MLDPQERTVPLEAVTHFERGTVETAAQTVDGSHHNETRREPMARSPGVPHHGPVQRTGRWTPDEKILFLYGLKRFGKGRWKKMSVYLPHRSLVQIKSHAQKVLKRLEAGENVFRRLEENYNIIDNLVVQAAKQHEGLAQAPHVPKSTVAKRSRKPTETEYMDRQVPQHAFDPMYEYSGSVVPQTPVDGDVAALAASALCQLSSL